MIDLSFINIPITALSAVIWTFLFTVYSYNIALAFYTAKKYKAPMQHPPETRFAIVIPAHNEASVLAPLLADLNGQTYPKELYDVFVVADNCNDNTLQIAEQSGVIALNRRSSFRGKGYALRYAFKRLFNHYHERNYKAVCIIDSDNLVAPNFLTEMNNALCEGHKVIQGNLGVKNPNDNWVTKAIAGSYYVTNSLWQVNKSKAGLSAACGGTGFCVSSDILKKHGWRTESLVEDLEFEVIMAEEGQPVFWCDTAKVYDEKPLSLKDAYRQRVRWLKGHMVVLRKHGGKLFKQFLTTRDVNLLDHWWYLLSVLFYGAVGLATVMWAAALLLNLQMFGFPLWFAVALNATLFAYMGLGVYSSTKRVRDLSKVVWMFIFSWVWIAAFFGAIVTWRDRSWTHTPHGVALAKSYTVKSKTEHDGKPKNDNLESDRLSSQIDKDYVENATVS
jgi:cellulose synthase/poly-beta-1,6-N-acetylglucosamine synthase-like glycosyltransferase